MDKLSILREKFGYDSFRPGQEETIDAILAGRDVLAVMPTGAGKSLCYQIPALLLDGMTIVISPLISLMTDQVSALHEAGCEAVFLNSSLTGKEYASTLNEILSGRVKLLYIAPERLQKAEMNQFTANVNIPLVVVDEAHCVSQWGHDFRTSYLQITDFIRTIKPRPVTAAFTATATVNVRDDIRKSLALRSPLCVNTGFDRPNLYFEVRKPKDKKSALLEYLDKRKNSSGIIYCATRKSVEETCQLLIRLKVNATRYHAGLDDDERKKNQDDFIYDRKTVMVATNAFGMGIDKSNVSFVIHYNMPKNIESYYQEAGRAGRDGSPADCVLLYNGQDVRINQYLITHGDEEESADEALVAHKLELLKQMTFYAAGNECLRRRLLAYFGEKAPVNCGNCSICLTEFTQSDVTSEAQKIVSCVYRLKQRGRSFGRTMIIDILRGGKNEKIRSLGFDSLSTWGIMKDIDAHRIRLILDHLIDKGILRLDEGEYPVVTLGRAEELLRNEASVVMKLPDEKKHSNTARRGIDYGEGGLVFANQAGENSAGTKKHHGEAVWTNNAAWCSPNRIPNDDEGGFALANSVGDKKKIDEKISRQGAGKSIESSAGIDDALLDKLKKLRKEIAGKDAVPAYIVFSDASLRDMCRKKPVSLVQFSGINGVGAVKLEKYGDEFTALIREYCGN